MGDLGTAFWHKESYDRFLFEELPRLLQEHLPLAGYEVVPTEDRRFRVTVAVTSSGGVAETTFEGIPACGEEGVFEVGTDQVTVVPIASTEELDEAQIACAGEQLRDFITERLGRAPAELNWDAALLRTWVPLDRWVEGFLAQSGRGETLDDRNWLSRCEHLRRIRIPDRQQMVAPGQKGRACPIQTPEGPNVGRVLHLARGAEIREGRIVVVDDRPEATLSAAASMIPFLEHDHPARALMGSNMWRQCEVLPEPEPALVRTGNEPDAPGVWCGRNLLTAFLSLGADTFEDAIVIGESAARRLTVEVGDKICNRHGSKGTIARVLPDERMPHLSDGTAVDLAFSFLGCHARLNFGQILEAIAGRLARAEGRSVVAAPFASPGAQELLDRLEAAGLPGSGMEVLKAHRSGPALRRPSTVGWVYWAKTMHLAARKIQAAVAPNRRGVQRQDELEFFVLRDAGAVENLLETFNTRAGSREDSISLAERVAAGPVEQAPPPTPAFTRLAGKLAVAGIAAEFDGGKLSFRFAPPAGEGLDLVQPIPHPWLPGQILQRIGAVPGEPAYEAVVDANQRVGRMLNGHAPESLREKGLATLSDAVGGLLDTLFTPLARPFWLGAPSTHLGRGDHVLFSGRAVLSVGPELKPDQLGLPETIAWELFGPLVTRKGDAGLAEERSERAKTALDEIMRDSWVLLNRAPSVQSTSILAFRPVRIPESVIRIHPFATWMLNADFDGDQGAVFLPVTEAGQREAAERLSVAAHLDRDPGLGDKLLTQEAVWGLAELSRTEAGMAEIRGQVDVAAGPLTRDTLGAAARSLVEREGAARALDRLDGLCRRGFEVAARSGASLAPDPARGMDPAVLNDPDRLADRIAARTDFDDDALGPQLLAVKSGARGTVGMLANLLGTREPVEDASKNVVAVEHGFSAGLSPTEYLACAAEARCVVARFAYEYTKNAYELEQSSRSKGFHVLARAMRARSAGIVFAQAAAAGEIDPLTDSDSRLFVGMHPTARSP
ncbi:MAG: hypothetical protein ACYTGV_07265 [Planctomycetota bacterium]|jgi:hypothetical protein